MFPFGRTFMECLRDAKIGQHHEPALPIDLGKDDHIPQTTRCEISDCCSFDSGEFAERVKNA